jgi:Protein of unknown function (DUF3102)
MNNPTPLEPAHPTSLAAAITAAHEAALAHGRSALEHARRAGDLLLKAKGELPHGAWLPWLAEHCPAVSAQMAQRYMRIARRWADLEAANTSHVTLLSIGDALTLLAAPREQRAEDDSADAASELDLAALLGDDEFEQECAAVKAELRVFERALTSPDLTIEEVAAIYHRAETLEGETHARRIRNLADIGRLLRQVRSLFGDELADLLRRDPIAVEKAAKERLTELQQSTSAPA